MFQTCDRTPPRPLKTLISQLDPSWFGLRPFPRVMGSYLRLDFKGCESMPDGMGCHLPMKLREQNSEQNHSLRRGIDGASNTDFHRIQIITWLVPQIVRCNDASLSFDFDKQSLQSVPQVAPTHRGNDCQTRWSVQVGSLFIITVASVSSSSDSKTLLLLQWHLVPDNRRGNHEVSIVAGKSSVTHAAAVVCVLNGIVPGNSGLSSIERHTA